MHPNRFPTLRRVCLPACLALLAAITPTQAETLYLRTSQSTSGSWDSANWATTTNGTGSVSAPAAGNTYNTNGLVLRTPLNAAPATFGGAALVIDGGSLFLKANTVTISNLSVTATGGTIQQTGASTANIPFAVTSFAVGGATTITSNGNGRSITFDIGTLTGSGDLNFGTSNTSNTFFVSATAATAFTGTLSLDESVLNFNNAFTSGGGLVLSGTGVLALDQDLVFASVSIGGAPLSAGTYSYTTLKSSYSAFFSASGSGSITVAPVPEPSTYALLFSTAVLLGVARHRLIRRPGKV